MEDLHAVAAKAIDDKSDSLAELGKNIWLHPELKFVEKYAHTTLTSFLEEHDFTVQRNYFLPTAFRAEFTTAKADFDVTIAILCEYDALPEIGHACGHNLIAEAGVGAALGVQAALKSKTTVKGRLVVIGTPAEEGGGGKILLIREGCFDDVDFAMMVHPGARDYYAPKGLAIERVQVTYLGREAHAAAAPWEGINALDGAVACYNNISHLRQQMKPSWRVHGIITDGGLKPNIIPGRAALDYYIRAPNREEVEELKTAMMRCFEAAALSSNCRICFQWDEDSAYDELNVNLPMALEYKCHAEKLGVKFDEQNDLMGSTDAGNLSRKIPTIHPIYSIPAKAKNHTPEFTVASGSPESQPPTIIAAKCMAMTALDLFVVKKFRDEAQAAFVQDKLKFTTIK